MTLGFDSTIGQLIHPVHALPKLLTGQMSLQAWAGLFHWQYGKEMHWSAFVIYGFMFWGLSHHFERSLNIKGSKNIAYATSLTLFSIAIFEFYWMICYALFQHQPWIITPQMPQLRIHLQNFAFLLVGGLGLLYLYVDSHKFDEADDVVGRFYKLRTDKSALGLITLTVLSGLLWIYYPGYVERFTVQLESGEFWSNTQFFPQTLYTIDMNPSDTVNAGVWFYHGNDWVHGLNALVKVLVSVTVMYVCLVKKVEDA